MSEAIRDIKSSKKFRKVLEYLLAIGNYVNGQGKRGGVWGFKLDTLEKFDRHRSTDGKSSLLVYLVKLLEKQDPELLDLSSDFANLEKARTISFTELQNQSKQLKSGMKVIEGLVKDAPSHNSDRFQRVFSSFLETNGKNIEVQEKELQSISSKLEALISSYGEDPSKMVRLLFIFVSISHHARLILLHRTYSQAPNSSQY